MSLSRFIILKTIYPTAIPDVLLWKMSGSEYKYYVEFTDSITHGSLSSLNVAIVKSGDVWKAHVSIVPDEGYVYPASSSDITVTTAATGVSKTYDALTGELTLIFASEPAADISAEVTTTCPPSIYMGAELGRAILGTMILGAE